jgi:S1-C subfamily serine protease
MLYKSKIDSHRGGSFVSGVFIWLCTFLPTIVYGQEYRGAKLDRQVISVNDEFRLEIQFPTASDDARCGLRIKTSTDETFDLRIGAEPNKGKSVIFLYKPKNPGDYKFELKGQFLSRGLNSLAACKGDDVVISGRVIDHEIFKSHVTQGRFEEALRAFERDFSDSSIQGLVEPELKLLGNAFRSRHTGELSGLISAETKARDEYLYIDNLVEFMKFARMTDQAVERYLRISIIQRYSADDPLIAEYNRIISSRREVLISRLPQIYEKFPHAKARFSSIYPYSFDERRAFMEWEQKFLTLVDQVADSELPALLNNTRIGWSDRPEIRNRLANRVLGLLSRNPIELLQGQSRLTTYGLTESDFAGFPKVYGGWASSRAEGTDVSFVGLRNSPLKSHSELSHLQGLNSDFVLIWIDRVKNSRNIVGQSRIDSTFRAGQRLVINPQYQANQIKCQTAQQDLARTSVRNSVNPSTNRLGAVLQGLGEVALQQSRDQACGEFSRTPMQVNEDVFRSYTYNVSDIRVDREVTGRVFSYSVRHGISIYPFEEQESKNYKLVSGKHRDDNSSSHGLITESDLDKEAQRPFIANATNLVDRVRTSSAVVASNFNLASLVSGGPTPSTAITAGQQTAQRQVRSTERLPSSGNSTHTDSRSQSVVIVRTANSLGTGFYIEPQRIITNAHVVGSTRTISLESVNGDKFTGVVKKLDIGRDLALIEVARPGLPLELAGHIVRQGDTVEALGHPKELYFSLTRGIVSALRRQRLAAGADHVQVIQMDTTIAPGNSGGPLFAKDKVIGINTFKLRDSSGLNFAVHSAEIALFLADVR